ncbi:MAG TPA: hypothetical protein PLK99_06745, partial [Burkholderiales bacterium]|nr:hypothetical protein [Burkholderiales bacterium]
QFASTKYGNVTAYDPNDYTVKVIIQPIGIETGFIPLAAAWVGNNYGAVFGPQIGDSVRLDFVDGSYQAALVGGRFFNNSARPPVVQAGQGAIIDKAGSYVKLNGDGTITLGAPTGITSTTPLLKQIGNLEVDGDVTVTQNIVATLDISDQNGAKGTMQHIRDNYDVHTHPDAQGGTTGTPSNSL